MTTDNAKRLDTIDHCQGQIIATVRLMAAAVDKLQRDVAAIQATLELQGDDDDDDSDGDIDWLGNFGDIDD